VTPSVTVIVPTMRPAAVVAGCLEALAEQALPRDEFEVVVVDDGGPEPEALDRLAETFRDRLDLRVLHRPNGGAGPARNDGAAVARAALLAFTDDDCRPEPRWLETLAGALDEDAPRAATGRAVNGFPANRFAEASQLVIDLSLAYYHGDPGRPAFLVGNTMALRAADLAAVGGFREGLRFGEDRELSDRLRAAGVELATVPGAVVRHDKELDAAGYVRQYFDYGRGAYGYHLHRAGGRVSDMRPDAGFYRQTLRSLRGRPAETVALLALWQAANAAGFAWEAAADATRRARA
jgi:GT2 family glycosyltransferase